MNISGSLYNRKQFINQLLAGLGSTLLYGCTGHTGKSLPNIVLIISDDQAWSDYSFMGHPAIRTPNLDKLASQSLVFTRGYVAAPLCGPSLASIISGLHPHQHKFTSNDPPFEQDMVNSNTKEWPAERRQMREQLISDFAKLPLLPGKLKKSGYLSMQTGKWWMGSYHNGGFTHGMTHGDMDRGGRHGDDGLKIGRDTMAPLYDFINDAGDNPFFVWYAPFLPHAPHNPPERILEKYLKKTESPFLARYWANCEWFDETCGDLLNFLDEKGITDNTIVLYICDNGWIQQPDKNGYAERSKRSPYEGGIRTPVMIKWPGHVTPGFNTENLVSAVDIVPTVLAACGLDRTIDMQGINILDAQALKSRSAVFGAAYTHNAVDIDVPLSSLKYTYVIEDDWKLIQPSGRNETRTEPELYNVMNDPEEKLNLAATNRDKELHLTSLLKDWWPEAVHDI